MLQKQITEFEVETVDLLLRLVSYDRHKKSNVIVLANDNSEHRLSLQFRRAGYVGKL